MSVPAPQPNARSPGPWLRRWLRRCRLLFLAAALAAVGSLVYLNQIGLPDFLKRPLLTQLHARGLDLYFSRLRLRWTRGIVAEDINLGQASTPLGPQLYIDEAEVRLNHAALRRLSLKVDALVVRKGRFVYPLPALADRPATSFSLDDLAAELWFLPDDRWEIRHLNGAYLQTRLELSGVVSHATRLRRPGPPSAPDAASARRAALERHLRTFVDTMAQTTFSGTPRLELRVNLDGRNPASLRTALNFFLEDATTPWGSGRRLLLTLNVTPSDANDQWLHTEYRCRAERWESPRLLLRQPALSGRLTYAFDAKQPRDLRAELSAAQLESTGLELENLRLSVVGQAAPTPSNWLAQATVAFDRVAMPVGGCATGQISAALTFASHEGRLSLSPRYLDALTNRWASLLRSPWFPTRCTAEIRAADAQTRWGGADGVRLHLGLSARPATPALASDASWSHWAVLEPFDLDCQAEIWDVVAPQLRVDRLALSADWHPPQLLVPHLKAHLFGGHFDADARLDVATRHLAAQAAASCDVHQIASLLNTNGQKWLRQYGWDAPPLASAQISLVLPAWTDRQPNWRRDVQPTMSLDGFVEGGSSSFRGAPAESARLHFSCQNGSWHIPDLRLTRPEGAVELAYAADVPTQDYFWRVRSTIDPKALKPLLPPGAARGVDRFEFRTPPVLAGDVWGRWKAVERLGFAAQVTLNPFTLNRESYDSLSADLTFTNRFLGATHIRGRRGEGWVEAAGVGFDASPKRSDTETNRSAGTLYFTNVVAQIDPAAVTRTIGPKTAAALAPYEFGHPPRVEVNGTLVLPAEEANLTFAVAGGPFKYSRFNLPEVGGLVLWQGDSLTISNFQGSFYKGRIAGTLDADIHSTNGSDIAFQVAITDVDARALLQDVSRTGNKLEGVLSGQLNITHLNSQDWASWFGQGRVRLSQGLIWDIPLFGFFSAKLDSLLPGVANIRFEQGSGTFGITNSVIHTRDLDIRSPWLRMKLEGAIDFDQRIDLRIGAELFKDLPMALRVPLAVVSLAATPFTKVLEYRATGTLREPQWEPVYIPKLLLLPLHPWKTLKNLFDPPPPAARPGSTPKKEP